MIEFLALILLALLSGFFGRMGGANGYDTKWRDIGCSFIVVLVTGLLFGWHKDVWWVYPLIFVLHWGAFATYWQFLFRGIDNLWFSGAMTGLAIAPIVAINENLWPLVVLRSIVLCVIWGALNEYLPNKPGRDIREEFWRYASSF